MGSLKCTLCCGESFGSKDELHSHLKSVLDNLFCSCCSSKFNSIQALLDHYAPHCNTVEVGFINGSKETSDFSIQHSPVEVSLPSKKKVVPEKTDVSHTQEFIVDIKDEESDIIKNCAPVVVKSATKILRKDAPGVCCNCYPCICKIHTSDSSTNHVSHDAKNPVVSITNTNGSGIVQNYTPNLVDNSASDGVQDNTFNSVENSDSGIIENHTYGAAKNEASDAVETSNDCQNQTSLVIETHNIFGNPTNDIFENSASQIVTEAPNNEVPMLVESTLNKNDETNEIPLEIDDLIYQCSCGMYFASLIDHLMTYHSGEEVIVKGALDKLEALEEIKVDECVMELAPPNVPEEPTVLTDTEKISSQKEEPQIIVCNREKQKDVDVKTCKPAHTPLTSSQIDQLDGKVEECLDKEGRLYLRKFVRVEKFWSKKDEEKAAQMKYRVKNYDSVRDVPVGSVSIHSKDETVTDSQTGSPKKLYQCSKCMTTFQTMFHFRYHVCNVTKTGTSTACNLCGHESTSAKELKAHWRMHQRQRRAAATALWEMQAGEVVHAKCNTEEGEDTELQCDRCGKMYKKSEVLIHVAMHDEQPPYKCPKCDLSYDSQDKLTRHARTHREQKNHCCLFCTKSFTDSNAFKLHMRSHTGEKPFECHFCSKKFSRPYERMKHERIHTGERPHVCDICGKTFRVSYCLTLHKRTHSGDRPYSCEICGKRFKAHSAFKHHVQIHSEARNYKCPYCPKAFKTMVHLAGHKKTHTKPFLCSECNRRFASLYSVKAHMESHKSGDNRFRYRCFVCGASYARAFALHAHMRTHGTCYPPEDVAEVLEICEEEQKKEGNMPQIEEERIGNKSELKSEDGEDGIRMSEDI